jgi:ADP-ribose pyrophosphatase YjhB (NUDIX family)
MVAGSILPVAIHNNKLYFLFGKENEYETSAPGWADFGGGCKSGETPYQTALREGSEELTGFLGSKSELKKLIKNNGGVYKIVNNNYHVYIFAMKYDDHLVKYYNNNHKFLLKNMSHNLLNQTTFFEKSEIKWFSVEEIKKKRLKFRFFYKEIINKILLDIDNIRKFVKDKGTH